MTEPYLTCSWPNNYVGDFAIVLVTLQHLKVHHKPTSMSPTSMQLTNIMLTNLFQICDQSDGGKCRCREGVGGRDCSQCLPGYWGFPDCQKCECNGHATTCDERTGTYIRTRVFPDSLSCLFLSGHGIGHINRIFQAPVSTVITIQRVIIVMSALMGTMVMPNFKHFTVVSKLMVNSTILVRLARVQMALDLDVNSLVHVIKVLFNLKFLL